MEYDLRLSAAASWVKCAAYPMMNKRPEALELEALGDVTVREEGTAIHWAAQTLMTGIDTVCIGSIAPNKVVITDELLDCALYYIDVLREYDLVGWVIEQQLPAASIHPRCGGTPDAYAVHHARKHIVIPDCKGGFVPVEVFPCWQLIGYSSAIIDTLTGIDDSWTVEFCIIQPRAFHRDGPVRKHTMRVSELRTYWAQLSNAAYAASGDNAPATSGAQCVNCNARVGCTVAYRAGAQALELSGEPDMLNLTSTAVDYELQRLEAAKQIIEARLTGLSAQAVHMLRRGEVLPHYVMQSGKGRKVWREGMEKHIIALGDMLGKDVRKKEAPITPIQAAKVLNPELVEAYSTRQQGELKLTRFDSNAVAKAFSNIKWE